MQGLHISDSPMMRPSNIIGRLPICIVKPDDGPSSHLTIRVWPSSKLRKTSVELDKFLDLSQSSRTLRNCSEKLLSHCRTMGHRSNSRRRSSWSRKWWLRPRSSIVLVERLLRRLELRKIRGVMERGRASSFKPPRSLGSQPEVQLLRGKRGI